MKLCTRISIYGTCVILFTTLSGCMAGEPGSTSQIPTSVGPSNQQTITSMVTVEPALTLVTPVSSDLQIPKATFTSSPEREDIAPSYEEIRRNVSIILQRGPTPQPDSTDVQYPPEFIGYHRYLLHMKVVDWEGWIDSSLSPVEDRIDRGTYALEVWREVPNEENQWTALADIQVRHVQEEQVRKLQEWYLVHKGDRWHKVKVSGRIASVDIGARVTLYGGSVEPLK
jgi:hypothetical protein